MRRILKDNKGAAYIELTIVLLVIMAIISVSMQIYPAFILKYNLDSFAHEAMRTAETSGQIGKEVDNKINRLENTLNITPEITWSTEYLEGKKIQLNSEIEVELIKEYTIKFLGNEIQIPINAKAKGRSEVYWK